MPGRILSKKNEERIKNAIATLKGMLTFLEDDDASEDEATEAADDTAATEAARLLESANLGNYLESRIHLAFTQIADDLFGEGRINRDERIALSGAIGNALTTFNETLQTTMPSVYERTPWADTPELATVTVEAAGAITEAALVLDTIPLSERALRADGTALIKLIQPGWGSSGYYPREVLERDGPKVFTTGLKQYWNHPTAVEESQRPEGDLNALAAELISDARYDAYGPKGPGLYADAKVFGPYQAAVEELAPHIGVSIRASGKAQQGKAEGREGPIIQAITSAASADYVTVAGAGGEIVQMFEAARTGAPEQKGPQMTEQQLQEAINKAIAPTVAENARLQRMLLERDARDAISTQLRRSTLPEAAQARLLERLQGDPPVVDGAIDGAALKERVQAAITSEATYLAQAAGYGSGRIEGMGGAPNTATPADLARNLEESFVELGISADQAKKLATF